MGHMRNHAIVVTSTSGDNIERAHKKAKSIFPWVSEISQEGVNGSRSFFVPPDGSQEGWEDSMEGDARRKDFKNWLHGQAYKDGSTPISWCEVRYGGDDLDAEIVAHCHERRTG